MTKNEHSPFDAALRNHDAEAALDEYIAKFRKTGILLRRPYPPLAMPQVRSRLGGLPQLPAQLEWPFGELYGKALPMHFLAQIDCAELPQVEPLMPKQGMLFFFAVNAEEQIWNTDNPQDRIRVLYAPEVLSDTPLRQPPETLQPILSVFASDEPQMNPPWLLPGEDGPRIHVEWPLIAHRFDTWPDHETLPDDDFTPDEERYQRRVAQLRLGAVVMATGLPTNLAKEPVWEHPFGWPWTFPVAWLQRQREFPETGIVMDRVARMIGVERIRKRNGQGPGDDALGWVRRASEIGLMHIVEENERQAFRDWIVDQIDEEDESKLRSDRMGNVFTRGILSAIAYTGASEETVLQASRELYEQLEDWHLPFEKDHHRLDDGRSWRVQASTHQMLGHSVMPQYVGDDEGESICLLQLVCDDAIDLKFGDCGIATFWINLEDLANLNFDRVAAIVFSH
jgi:uncharacterized protein YwqG